jgi:hypothetical protein
MSDKEISVKDTFLRVYSYIQLIWSKKLWVVIAAVLLGGIFAYRAFVSEVTYKADVTFMVNEKSSEGGGMLSSVLGQFGLGGGASGGTNYNRILEISNSDKITRELLIAKSTVGSEDDYLVNHIINTYDLHKDWEDDTLLVGYYLDSMELFGNNSRTKKANVAFKVVSGILRGSPSQGKPGLLSIGFSEESGILGITCNSKSEELSAAIVNSQYNILSDFYINQSIGGRKETYRQLVLKVDSIKRLMNGSESAYASGQDKSLGFVLNRDRLGTARAFTEIQMYQEMYAEAIKNKETAEFILNSNTPFFQLLDSPVLPLKEKKDSFIKAGIIGVLVGSFICILVVIGISVTRETFA